MSRGAVTYDAQHGHVCTCTAVTVHDDDTGDPLYTNYDATVRADPSSATETGSYWYSCSRCGAGAWSGC